MLKKLYDYVEEFNNNDNEFFSQLIPNDKAFEFLSEQIPLIDIPDKELEKIYYFRWWTYRKHFKDTPDGHIITEFLPQVPWSGPHNSINCPAGFHIREGRWLKDQNEWLKEYINFWLDGKGETLYSSWYAHATLEYCTIKNDFAFAAEALPKLVKYYEQREKTHSRGTLYWTHDGLDGMEVSISGSGLRPTGCSYAYGDAAAIAKIAEIAGENEIKERFYNKATEIKAVCDKLLWNKDFYKVIPLEETQDNTYTERPKIPEEHDVREELGYVPWYFNMPDNDKCIAFEQLLTTNGFKAEYGITSAEQRHPRFMFKWNHECLWNGPAWPFATSQTLVAVANALRNYNQNIITKENYYELLLQYAKAHKININGKELPWIDENYDPFTGEWIARSILEGNGWVPEKGGFERGKDYNHSLFCDLILSGLLGVDVKDGEFIVNPLIPNNWDYYKIENLWLSGKRYRITYKAGEVLVENY